MIDAYIFVMIGLVIVFLFTTMTDKKLLHISIVGKKSITKQMARLGYVSSPGVRQEKAASQDHRD